MNSKGTGVGETLYGGAGRQHGACSETFWASCIMLFVFPGKDGRVTGRTESPPESQMDYVHFLPPLALSLSLLCYLLETANIIDVAFFLCVAREQRNCSSLACYRRAFLPLILCLSTPLSLPNLLSYLAFISQFHDLFCKHVWPVLLSVTSKERFVLIISISDSDSDKTSGCGQLGVAVWFIMPLISFLAASRIHILDKPLTLSRKGGSYCITGKLN